MVLTLPVERGRSETIEQRTNRQIDGKGEREAWRAEDHEQWQMHGWFPQRQNKEGNEVTLCLGASCPVLCLLQPERQGVSGRWLTLPLAIAITQALLLCFQPWFLCYLLTLHSIEADTEMNGSRQSSHSSAVFKGDRWKEQHGWWITCKFNQVRRSSIPHWNALTHCTVARCFHEQKERTHLNSPSQDKCRPHVMLDNTNTFSYQSHGNDVIFKVLRLCNRSLTLSVLSGPWHNLMF